jgi:hypothetical protein
MSPARRVSNHYSRQQHPVLAPWPQSSDREELGMDGQGSRHRVWRSRWAAIGAAVAVSLGAGGVFFADASSVVMVAPARILDTRDPVNVGLNGPFVSAIGQDLQVTGLIATTSGPATVVPTGATGVILNVTVVAPAASGFVSVRPANAPGAPTTSNLNFLAGEVVPNAVSVELPTAGPDAGRIEIAYDAYGVAGPTADVLIDVVGYTMGADGADGGQVAALQAQVASLESRLAAIEAESGESRAAHSAVVQTVALTSTDVVVRSVTITPTADGKIIATAAATFGRADLSQFIGRCSITTGSTVDPSSAHYVTFPGVGATLSDVQNLAGTRGFDVAAGVPVTVRLVCDRSSGNGGITASSLTAVFAPD